MKKKITIPNDLHQWKGMTETICFGLVLECQHILIGALDFFQRSGHHIMPPMEDGQICYVENFPEAHSVLLIIMTTLSMCKTIGFYKQKGG